ncbi:MAG: beta-galactosidase [Kiritimatiellae bacterium]|nr:beta-galactosidase [Kiritimatiellia bacterium]
MKKNIRCMLRRQFCRLVFPLAVIAAAAAQGVTVTPVATDEALINPGMGFMCYHMAGRMWAYGAPIPPGDTLDWFPGTSTVYFRFLWSEIEPEEGQFRWDMIDRVAQNWIAKGKKIAFRIICCNHTANACPDYVRAAGAKGIWFRYANHGAGKDFPERWEPVYDDPVFLEKYSAFLKAFADRYDGDPNVAFVDVGSFGMYGEGHTGSTSTLSKEETDRITRLHLKLHRRLLPNTLLIISDDVAGSGGQEPEAPLMKFARELGIGYRDDSIFCMGPEPRATYNVEGSWAHSHWARNFAPETPVVIETGHWTMCKERGRWVPERLLECVEKHQASYLSIHAFPRPYYEAHKELMAQIAKRLGYRIELRSV